MNLDSKLKKISDEEENAESTPETERESKLFDEQVRTAQLNNEAISQSIELNRRRDKRQGFLAWALLIVLIVIIPLHGFCAIELPIGVYWAIIAGVVALAGISLPDTISKVIPKLKD